MSSWGTAAVPFEGVSDPAQLVAPMALETVFTRAERLRSGAGRTVRHWAGRLAAKQAVLRLLDVEPTATTLGGVAVLPQPSALCVAGAACLHGHPPRVVLHASLHHAATDPIRVSISHDADLAVAVAVTGGPLPEDAR